MSMKPTLFLLLLIVSGGAGATEVYHWVDENGVANFSQAAPPAGTAGVSRLAVEDRAPPGYDPDEDIYHVQAQAERMQALRDDLAARREDRLERERQATLRQSAAQPRPVVYERPPWWYPPYRPRPPIEPPIEPPPVAEPYDTRILIPPGRLPD
jgi:hypothetical protein